MKKSLTLILVLSLSAALMLGCTASAQRADQAYAEPAPQPEMLAKTGPEPAQLYDEGAELAAAAIVPVEQAVSAAPGGPCTVCSDGNCDGGTHYTDGDQWTADENCGNPCKVCGDDSCDGGAGCAGRADRQNNHHGGHRHHNG